MSPRRGPGGGFEDRRAAGRLTARLGGLAGERPVVYGLRRGGVPVAAEVASALGAPLDAVVARKPGAPADPEIAAGAVAEDGSPVVDPVLAQHAGAARGAPRVVVAAPVGSAEAIALVRRAADEVVTLLAGERTAA